MPTQSQVQQTILSAQYKLAKNQQSNLALVNAGNLPKKVCVTEYLNLNILGLTYRANISDYTSSTAVTIYDRLLGLIGVDTTANNLDPNYQNPTSPIIIPGQSAFGFVKSLPIPFNTNHVILANWQANYAPLYGSNPSVEIFTDQAGVDQVDTQTAPIYNYATPGDETTLLQSIEWTYPFTTAGYYTISGQVPASGGGSVVGSSTFFIIIPFGSPQITTDGDGNFVYTDTRLIGKSGYFANATMLTQILVDGVDLMSNPALGNFTIINPPAFTLVPGAFLIVFVQ